MAYHIPTRFTKNSLTSENKPGENRQTQTDLTDSSTLGSSVVQIGPAETLPSPVVTDALLDVQGVHHQELHVGHSLELQQQAMVSKTRVGVTSPSLTDKAVLDPGNPQDCMLGDPQ